VAVALVVDELSARGFNVLVADSRKSYDLLVRTPESPPTQVRVRTVHFPPWYVNLGRFAKGHSEPLTVYVLLGGGAIGARFFVVQNDAVSERIRHHAGWKDYGFLDLEAVQMYENNWNALRK
jgi:hypothetical protein